MGDRLRVRSAQRYIMYILQFDSLYTSAYGDISSNLVPIEKFLAHLYEGNLLAHLNLETFLVHLAIETFAPHLPVKTVLAHLPIETFRAQQNYCVIKKFHKIIRLILQYVCLSTSV
jgi:hypothetical protein